MMSSLFLLITHELIIGGNSVCVYVCVHTVTKMLKIFHLFYVVYKSQRHNVVRSHDTLTISIFYTLDTQTCTNGTVGGSREVTKYIILDSIITDDEKLDYCIKIANHLTRQKGGVLMILDTLQNLRCHSRRGLDPRNLINKRWRGSVNRDRKIMSKMVNLKITQKITFNGT